MAAPATGRDFGMRLLRAMGLDATNVASFTLHCQPDSVRLRVEYLAPRSAMEALVGEWAEYELIRRPGPADAGSQASGAASAASAADTPPQTDGDSES